MEIIVGDLPRENFQEIYIVVCYLVVHVPELGECEAPYDWMGKKVVEWRLSIKVGKKNSDEA